MSGQPGSDLERLLVVQEHDTTADQLLHRRAALPERAQLAEVEAAVDTVSADLAEVTARRDEVARRQRAREDEVAGVEAKAAEVNRRLYSGSITAPRELQAMQADVDSLKRHRSAIEDDVLAAMEEREPLDGEVDVLGRRLATLSDEGTRLRYVVGEAEFEIDGELETVQGLRGEAALGLPEALTTLYEQLRTRLGGVAAARLEPGGRCGGCHLTLPATEVARIKRAPADSLARCDNCGRILVRTD